MSNGLKLGWGGLVGEYVGFWGGLLRNILELQSRAHIELMRVYGISGHHPSIGG